MKKTGVRASAVKVGAIHVGMDGAISRLHLDPTLDSYMHDNKIVL